MIRQKDYNKTIELKGIIWEDMINYKKISTTLMFPKCTFKCDKENGTNLCQNRELAAVPSQTYDIDDILELYKKNPITEAIVLQGLEPLDSAIDVLTVSAALARHNITDDLVIYTGYNYEDNNTRGIIDLIAQDVPGHLIVKFGRFRPNQTPHFDPILGVNLASSNQYTQVIK